MPTVRYSSHALSAIVLPLLVLCGGCGAFSMEDGLYPLPAIHIVFPIPSDYGLTFEDVQLTADNGQTIYGWFIPASAPRATILIHHGAVTNRSAGASYYVLFQDLGCNVFTYDYQGFAENWSLATLATVLPDADVALSYVQGRAQADAKPIIILGASMGTAPAFTQAARNPAGVAGVIVEGSCIPQDLSPYVLALVGMAPSPEAFLNFPAEMNPETNVPLITLPKLFIHSPTDNMTPIAGARKLYDIAVEPKRFEEVAGDHVMAATVDAEHYRAIVSSFLDQILGSQTP